MKKDDNIYIPSDKGGEMVVMTLAHYKSIALQHLNDSTTYQRVEKNSTPAQEKAVNELWKRATKESQLPKNLIDRLTTRHSSIAQIYHLPKTHKRFLAARPIVSNISSPCEKMAWFLQQLLSPFLADVPAHLDNTYQLLSQLKAVSPSQLQNKMVFSLDVVSLYTNVQAQEALDISSELLRNKYRDSIWGIPVDSIIEILFFVLRSTSFHFDGVFFNQIRGLAMGSKISPTLAILVMDRIKRSTVFLRTLSSPLVFLRYVDDCVVIVDNDTDFTSLLPRLNSIHTSIKFEMELPKDDGFLPVLDTAVRINSEGEIEHKFFVKETNKGLFLNATSALPSSIKRNAIRCELNRAQSLCSTDEQRSEATKAMTQKFKSNGYTNQDIRRYQKKFIRRKVSSNDPTAFSSVMKVPFISDNFNGHLKRLIKKSGLDICVVTQPAKSLSRLLNKVQRYRKCNKSSCQIRDDAKCFATNVVYKAQCDLCSEFYIGSTSPPFHERVGQHLQPSRKTAVYLHAIERHQRNPKDIFQFSIVSYHSHEIRCRIAEAITINKLAPKINRKEEFLDFRGFLI